MSDPDEHHAAVQHGLAAWTRGDLDAVEAVLDPAVTLKAMQAGPWDCDNGGQLMTLLRRREAERVPGQSRDVEVRPLDDATCLVCGVAGGGGVGTLVTIARCRVISLQQVSTMQSDPQAQAAVAAIRCGDSDSLSEVLAARTDLVSARVSGCSASRRR